jgi:hypothetical protein
VAERHRLPWLEEQPPSDPSCTVWSPSGLADLPRVRREFRAWVTSEADESHRLRENRIGEGVLALDELMSDALRHGRAPIDVLVCSTDGGVLLQVADRVARVTEWGGHDQATFRELTANDGGVGHDSHMASAESPGHTSARTHDHERKANPTGAYVATAGVLIFLVSVFLDWFTVTEADESVSGYDADGAVPFTAYLGVGLVVALFYALSRARGRQHRGLTLVTMAVGIAAVLLSISNLIDATGIASFDVEVDVEIGPWVALVGSIIWSVGAGLLAKEPEGDDDWRDSHAVRGTRQGH